MQSDVVRVELASGAVEVVSGSKVPVVRVAVDQGGTSSVALPEVHIGTGAPTGDEVLWVDTDEPGPVYEQAPEVHVGTAAPTGDEVLWVDTDAPGTAYEQAGAVAAHESAADPHPQYLPLEGGLLQGELRVPLVTAGEVVLTSDTANPLAAVRREYVDDAVAAAGGGIPEAPSDGKQYARQDGDWSEVAATGGASTLDGLSDVTAVPATTGDVLTYTVSGGTSYAYQGVPANNGIIAGLGGQAAHDATLRATQSSTNAGETADRALSANTAQGVGRSHTTNQVDPWWMVEFLDGAVMDVTHFAVRTQDHNDGFHGLPLVVEGRAPGTAVWNVIGTIPTDPGRNLWADVVVPASTVRCDAIRIRVAGTTYLVLGSVEAWGVWYPAGETIGGWVAKKPFLVLGPTDPVPPGTPAGTVIVRRTA